MKKTMKNSINQLNKIDTFSPYFFLPFILILYFFISLFDFHRFELFNVSKSIWPVVILAILSYYIGVYIIDKKDWTLPSFGLSFLNKYVTWMIWLLGFIGAVAYFTMIIEGSIGLTDESVRRNLDPKLNFLSQLLWFGIILLLSLKIMKEKNLTKLKIFSYAATYGVIMVLFLLMGYRTPIVIMLFTGLIISHYVIKKVNLTWFFSVLLVIGVFFSLFGFFRVISEDTSIKSNSQEQPEVVLTEVKAKELETVEQKVNKVPKWIRSLNGESVTGHIVLSKIIEYTDENGYLYGEIHEGIFTTILPGEQTSPRMKVTEIVNSLSIEEGKFITRPSRTTTPTYIGQLFLDGGYILVASGFLIFGVVISLLYNQVKREGHRSYQAVAYAFVSTMFTISMHTGLLDLIFYLMIGFVILTSAIGTRKSTSLTL
ncbi:oligosaccharide repeat unit polymerase [Psychrobacillus insolitus]|uniref:Oligosaccharide repeat unit polymerase n=1 Tax=Psychrobacillus insolitus TaxID=1461 RepID=A0A2W7MSW4_9BACI|nr:oligosaccharide repeat unit polymerase [Psychrobacillus insolitus]PZX08284.1 oligosaccharide repeat unit polymerase [Psychrobacillus insolitus]